MSATYHNSTPPRQNGHKQKRILIVEDDPRIVDYVSIYCQSEGYEVTHARDGVEAIELFKQVQPDFVLLDLMLPRVDGLEVCRQIRITSEVPIIMVTARIDEVDKLLGLETGADDYLTKPFSPRELMARIRVIFRRLEKSPKEESVSPQTEKVLNLGRLSINFDTREVSIENKLIPPLTNKEFELLITLAQQPGRVFTKTELEEALYDCDSLVASRAIGVHISNLRAKLPNAHLVETIHGVGYKLSREAV